MLYVTPSGPAPRDRRPSPPHTHPSSFPLGDPSPFNHLADGAGQRLRPGTFPGAGEGNVLSSRVGSRRTEGGTSPSPPSRPSPAPSPPHVPMHLLSGWGLEGGRESQAPETSGSRAAAGRSLPTAPARCTLPRRGRRVCGTGQAGAGTNAA